MSAKIPPPSRRHRRNVRDSQSNSCPSCPVLTILLGLAIAEGVERLSQCAGEFRGAVGFVEHFCALAHFNQRLIAWTVATVPTLEKLTQFIFVGVADPGLARKANHHAAL